MHKKNSFVYKAFALAVLVLLQAACAETELISQTGKSLGRADESANHLYKVGSPYQINGYWYYPHEDFNYVEDGVASWYGPNFDGNHTANGETYNQNALTAAHRTLPMPSLVRVTNKANGRSVVVRINDRGPYARNRIIDLSKRAAQLLGFEQQGTAEVRVEIMAKETVELKNRILRKMAADEPRAVAAPTGAIQASDVDMPPPPPPGSEFDTAYDPGAPASSAPPQPAPANPNDIAAAPVQPTPTLAAAPGGYYIQAASFSDVANANRSVAALQSMGPTEMSTVRINGRNLYRVRIGPLPDKAAADNIAQNLVAQGYQGAHVVNSN